MRLIKILCCSAAIASIAAIAAPSARADDWNKKTILTFSGPVQIPGTTLPAGTYVFQLADLEGNRHVVQILEKDGKLITMFLTVPDYKLDAPDKSVVMFEERPRGMPQAIKAWFYPGDSTGDEFVYPKSQALKIARESHTSVLAMNDDTAGTTSDSMKGAKIGRVTESDEMADASAKPSVSAPVVTTSETTSATSSTAGTTVPTATATTGTTTTGTTATTGSTTATVASTGTTGRTRTRAQASPTVGTSASTSTPVATTDAPVKNSRKRLPRTASELALFELLSAAAFVGFLATRELRKRFVDHA